MVNALFPNAFVTRRGFTAIELLVVIGIAVTLIGMSVPAMLQARAHARVTSAGEAIMQVASAARLRALTAAPETNKRYGVRVDFDATTGLSTATLTYGATPATDLNDASGTKPLLQTKLTRNLVLKQSGTAISTIGWLYEPRTGLVIDSANEGAALIDVLDLVLSSADQRIAVALGVYKCGLVHQESL